MSGLTALVLAGRRGPSDSLARSQGTSHRALIDVAGVPMLLRVVRALRASPRIERICVSIDEPSVLGDVPELQELIADGALVSHTSLASPSLSVRDALERRANGESILVTTADHALLTPTMVEHFIGASEDSDADLLLGVVAASLLRAKHPETERTYLRLRGDAYTGANLFAFRTPRAQRAAEFWTRAEAVRKQPWRLMGRIGPLTLLLFALGRLDLEGALSRVSRAMGARVRPVVLPFAEAGIDVDRASDLALARRILEARAAG